MSRGVFSFLKAAFAEVFGRPREDAWDQSAHGDCFPHTIFRDGVFSLSPRDAGRGAASQRNGAPVLLDNPTVHGVIQ